jgi:hypothetical protein
MPFSTVDGWKRGTFRRCDHVTCQRVIGIIVTVKNTNENQTEISRATWSHLRGV